MIALLSLALLVAVAQSTPQNYWPVSLDATAMGLTSPYIINPEVSPISYSLTPRYLVPDSGSFLPRQVDDTPAVKQAKMIHAVEWEKAAVAAATPSMDSRTLYGSLIRTRRDLTTLPIHHPYMSSHYMSVLPYSHGLRHIYPYSAYTHPFYPTVGRY